MKTKICSVCKQEKSIDDFYHISKKKPRPRSECKECHKHYRNKHASHRAMQMKEWHLKRNYNLTLSDYCERFMNQGGVCAICGKKNQQNTKYPLMVDHDHKTNKVRGLLCSKCNLGLGHFQDNINIIAKALTYLESFKNQNKQSGNST